MTGTRTRVRLVTFIIAAIVIFGGLAFQNYQLAQRYRDALQVSYLRAVEDLTTYTENIASTLTKGMYAGTPAQLNALTAQLWKESSAAKTSLAQLPTSRFNLENTYKFLAQVGEYAVSLAKKSENGEQLTDEERQNLAKLSDYANSLEQSMLVIQDEVRSGRMNIGTEASAGPSPEVGEDLAEFEEGFTAYPTLIYDGPFSDHLQQKEPEKLKDTEKVTLAQAREKAASAFNVDSGKMANDFDEEGNMPSYCFSFESRTVSITKQGGYLSYLTDPRQPASTDISVEEALHQAQNYLNWLKIPDMTLTYYEIGNNVLTANYAYTEGDVLFYTDLIKVSVAMDTGGILGFDARGYLTSNHVRSLPSPTLSPEEAQQSVSPILSIDKSRLAVIPSGGQQERYCYEFQCRSEKGDDLLVYINADTGAEEQILILIIDENGTLTI